MQTNKQADHVIKQHKASIHQRWTQNIQNHLKHSTNDVTVRKIEHTCIMSFSPLHCKYSLINNPIAVTRLMMIAFAGFVLKSPANLLFTASSQGYNRRFGTAIKLLMRKRFCIYINSSYVTCISCRTFYFLINPPDTLKQCSDFLHLIAINC